MKPPLWISVFVCVATVLPGQTKNAVVNRPHKPATAKPVASPEVQALRDAVNAQQMQIQQQHQEIEELKSQLQQVLTVTERNSADLERVSGTISAAQASVQGAEQTATEAKVKADQAIVNVGEVKTSLAFVGSKSQEENKKISTLETLTSRMRFTGDIRIRGESFFQGCAACVVLASFTQSEQRAPTNLLGNRFYGAWKLQPNTVASYTLWVGRTLNTNLQNAALAPGRTSGQDNPYLKRMQFDVLYSF